MDAWQFGNDLPASICHIGACPYLHSNSRNLLLGILGFARAMKKPLLCIARAGTTIPFDVSGLRVLFFRTYRSLEEMLAHDFELLLRPKSDA